jgi:gliding motility-associated lipoprotein GldH
MLVFNAKYRQFFLSLQQLSVCIYSKTNGFSILNTNKMLMFKIKYLYIALLSAIFLISCGNKYVFDETKSVNGDFWQYKDSLTYTVNIVDTAARYDIIATITHDEAYANENLYVKIGTKFPDGKAQQDLISLELADKTGQWYGKGSSTVVLDIPLQQRAHLNQKGKYTFSFKQYTRNDSLQGIKSVGLKLQPSVVSPK